MVPLFDARRVVCGWCDLSSLMAALFPSNIEGPAGRRFIFPATLVCAVCATLIVVPAPLLEHWAEQVICMACMHCMPPVHAHMRMSYTLGVFS